jgi:hypothetical protein
MNNTFLAFFTFILILFSYIHITAQWKTSDDLEIYEADFESASQLQEICAVKQPVVFKFQKENTAIAFFERFQSAHFEKYDNIDIRVKDRQDYNKPDDSKNASVDYVPLSFRSARRLFTTDTGAKYFSEKNHIFLEESGLDRLSHTLDAHLKPPLSAYTKHDILLGSPLVQTPLQYRLESHHFIAVSRGKISVKLCPPKYSKIIPTFKDYENYEFWSPLNPWKTKDQTVLQKIKFIDIDVHTGDILFIPSYWWYSISFSGDPETTVASFTYDVAMNIVAQSNHWGLFYLQQNNIKTRPAKKIIVSEDGNNAKEDSSTTLEEVAQTIVNSIENDLSSSSQPAKREIITNAGTYNVLSTSDIN